MLILSPLAQIYASWNWNYLSRVYPVITALCKSFQSVADIFLKLLLVHTQILFSSRHTSHRSFLRFISSSVRQNLSYVPINCSVTSSRIFSVVSTYSLRLSSGSVFRSADHLTSVANHKLTWTTQKIDRFTPPEASRVFAPILNSSSKSCATILFRKGFWYPSLSSLSLLNLLGSFHTSDAALVPPSSLGLNSSMSLHVLHQVMLYRSGSPINSSNDIWALRI